MGCWGVGGVCYGVFLVDLVVVLEFCGFIVSEVLRD